MRYALRVRELPSHPAFPSVFSLSTLETFDSGVTRGVKPICVRVANLMEDAGIDVDSVTPLTPNRAQSWLLEPPSCDTELTRFSKPHTHAEELRQEARKHITTNYTDCTHYYTDGSKASQGIGCAFVSDAGNGSRSLPKEASVFTAQLTAILMCLDHILHNTDDCAILTDSLSSILGLRDTSSDAPLRMSILERAREADRRGIAVMGPESRWSCRE